MPLYQSNRFPGSEDQYHTSDLPLCGRAFAQMDPNDHTTQKWRRTLGLKVLPKWYRVKSATTWNQMTLKRWIYFWDLDVQIYDKCEKLHRHRDTLALPTYEWFSSSWTNWMKIQYIFFTFTVNEMEMETNAWHCTLIENITVLGLKELCCLGKQQRNITTSHDKRWQFHYVAAGKENRTEKNNISDR